MYIKQILSFIFIFFAQFVMAQDFSIDKKIKTIDSLIEYRQFEDADKRSTELLQLLDKEYGRKEYLEQRIRLKLLQGKIFDAQFEHSKAFPLFLESMEEAEDNNLYKLACEIKLSISSNQEAARNYSLSFDYLKEAQKIAVNNGFEDLYSSIFLKYATLYRFVSDTMIDLRANQRELLIEKGLSINFDSATYYANKAIIYAKKYNNEADINEGGSLLGIITRDKQEKLQYFKSSIPYLKKVNHYDHVGVMYTNIADIYRELRDYNKALMYSDSSFLYYNKMSLYYKYTIPETRYEIFDVLGNVDSSYHYFKMTAYDAIEYMENEDQTEIKRLEEQYQNDKKEAVIQSKNQWIVFVVSLLVVITIATILLVRSNRKIKSQNKIISKQVEDLVKTLEQKQVLLSELQHRVKNNLQHVISILEIQKESVDFNNIDELIRGNQNRIHSMALLHKKLNVSDNVNDVDLKRYIGELSELVKDSYDNHKKKVQLNINCEMETISIEKALPLGLVIVELVSNSMKHAFKKRSVGIINIEIKKDEVSGKSKLYYADNGNGFDFNRTTSKGLGLEIIKGLIDQLDGTVETNNQQGFELTMYFK